MGQWTMYSENEIRPSHCAIGVQSQRERELASPKTTAHARIGNQTAAAYFATDSSKTVAPPTSSTSASTGRRAPSASRGAPRSIHSRCSSTPAVKPAAIRTSP